MTQITLTTAEIQMAAFVGCQRAVENLKKGRMWSRTGESPDQLFDLMVRGALAEAALAKHFNKFWAKGEPNLADIDDVDVRCSHHENGHLEIHPHDIDDRKYYFLTGMNGSYKLKGWIYAKDAKKPEYWRVMKDGRKPQFWVPQAVLNDNIYQIKEKDWLDD